MEYAWCYISWIFGSISSPYVEKKLVFVFKVCLEGEISKSSIMNSLARGKRASGDLIPWTISQQVLMISSCGQLKFHSVQNWPLLRVGVSVSLRQTDFILGSIS